QFFKWTFARLLFCVDLDDVNPELSLNQIADCTDAEAECGTLEFRNHLAMAEIPEISSASCSGVFGELFGEAAEVFAFLRPFQNTAGLLFDFFDLLRRLSLGLVENMLGLHPFRNRVFVFVL